MALLLFLLPFCACKVELTKLRSQCGAHGDMVEKQCCSCEVQMQSCAYVAALAMPRSQRSGGDAMLLMRDTNVMLHMRSRAYEAALAMPRSRSNLEESPVSLGSVDEAKNASRRSAAAIFGMKPDTQSKAVMHRKKRDRRQLQQK